MGTELGGDVGVTVRRAERRARAALMLLVLGLSGLIYSGIFAAQDVDAHNLAAELHTAGRLAQATLTSVQTSTRGRVSVRVRFPAAGAREVTLASAWGASGDGSYRGAPVGGQLPVLYTVGRPDRAMAWADVDDEWDSSPVPFGLFGLAGLCLLVSGAGAWFALRKLPPQPGYTPGRRRR